jgi:hypothetical protein
MKKCQTKLNFLQKLYMTDNLTLQFNNYRLKKMYFFYYLLLIYLQDHQNLDEFIVKILKRK